MGGHAAREQPVSTGRPGLQRGALADRRGLPGHRHRPARRGPAATRGGRRDRDPPLQAAGARGRRAGPGRRVRDRQRDALPRRAPRPFARRRCAAPAQPPGHALPRRHLARLLGRRVVFDHHDLTPELVETRTGCRAAGPESRAGASAGRSASATIVVSSNESYAEIARERGGKQARDVVVVRNGPKEETLSAGAQIAPGRPRRSAPGLRRRGRHPGQRRRPARCPRRPARRARAPRGAADDRRHRARLRGGARGGGAPRASPTGSRSRVGSSSARCRRSSARRTSASTPPTRRR